MREKNLGDFKGHGSIPGAYILARSQPRQVKLFPVSCPERMNGEFSNKERLDK